MFINKLWRKNNDTLMTLHCVSCRIWSFHLLGSSFGIVENICTIFTHISQKWFYFSVHYAFYLYISLGRRNWLEYRGRFFGPRCTCVVLQVRRPHDAEFSGRETMMARWSGHCQLQYSTWSRATCAACRPCHWTACRRAEMSHAASNEPITTLEHYVI